MNRLLKPTLLLALALALQPYPYARAEDAGKPLAALTGKGAPSEEGFAPSSAQVSLSRSADAAAPGVIVTIPAGPEQYPGVHLTPPSKPWDVSAFGHIEARITNTGAKPLSLSLRVDGRADGADNTSNTESVGVKPGETKTAKVIFGYSYGYKPTSRPNPAAISRLVLFVTKSTEAQSFRVESIQAAGPAGEKPPFNPNEARLVPKNGMLLGSGETIDAAKQIEAENGASAALDGAALKITFPESKDRALVALKPSMGRWDLRQAFEVRIKVKNDGKTAVTPRLQVTSNPGPTDLVSAGAPLAPGAEGEIAVSFAPSVPWLGIEDSVKTSWDPQKGTGTKFASDAVSAVHILPDPAGGAQALTVTSIKAGVPPPPALPDWLGKRPPVDGDWVKTFDEEFDGPAIDQTKWNVYADNFWDKRSHFSKDNVVLGGGVVKLHYAKKTGFHNDDPALKQTDYATGFLDTYGKWVQRYGYFEARMKLTSAPGLWPAFWLMPDRGAAAGAQWKRASTSDGGMEFDIMEYLGRWGPYRYNIAWHWDGYDKAHQQTGTQNAYFQPDKDGFITAGLLWLPGQSVLYANGKEIARWKTPRMSTIPSDMMFTNVSGGWDNNQIDDAKLPDDFVIDYVRAWQRKDLASAVDGVRQEGRREPKAEAPAP